MTTGHKMDVNIKNTNCELPESHAPVFAYTKGRNSRVVFYDDTNATWHHEHNGQEIRDDMEMPVLWFYPDSYRAFHGGD